MIQKITDIVALVLFIASAVAFKLECGKKYKFAKPIPLRIILLSILYGITLIIGLIAAIWNIAAPV